MSAFDNEGYGDCEVGEADWLEEQAVRDEQLAGINSCDALRIIDGVTVETEE